MQRARAGALLAGPRGRALCTAVAGLDSVRLLRLLARPTSAGMLRAIEASQAGRPGWPPAGWEELNDRGSVSPPSPAELVARHVAQVDVGTPACIDDDRVLVSVLAEAVNGWAFSDDEIDAVSVLSEAGGELAPIAAALAQAPGSAWWWSPIERGGPPPLGDARKDLAAWSRQEAADEADASSRVPFPPAGSGPRYSGRWWSPPRGVPVLGTTRALPGIPAVQLALCEDFPGDDVVEVWEVSVDPDAKVYEVDGPCSWCALVGDYPREMTFSRRHDWWRWTGWEGR